MYVDRLTSWMFVDWALYFEEDQKDQRTRRTRSQGFIMARKNHGVSLPRRTKWTTLMKFDFFGKFKNGSEGGMYVCI